ncbi:MAG: EAL domain-containing protein [Pleurocapsa sp.]
MVKPKQLVNLFFKAFNLRSTCRSTIFVTSLIVLAICSIRQLGNIEFLELAVFDLMMRSRLETEQDARITIIGIDESDIQTWQQSTFSDRLIAQLLKEIQQHNPAVLGLNIYRDLPHLPRNAELLKQLAAENVFVTSNIDQDGDISSPSNVSLPRVGFNNLLLDSDGKVRRNLLMLQIGDQTMYSLALQLSKSYLNAEFLEVQPELFQLKQSVFPALKANSGGYQLSASDARGAQILLNYRSPDKAAKLLSFSQILNGDFNPDWIRGKVILIGYTAPSKKDLFSTPFDVERMPGVMVQAHMVSQILSTVLDGKPLFRFLPEWGEFIWIWLWSIIGAVIVWQIKHPLILGGSLIIAVGVLSGICFVSFLSAIWIPAIPAMIGLLSTTGVILAYKTFYSSVVDELTGLANREQMVSLLQQSIAKSKTAIAVLSIDLARFKTVNDSLGSLIGDRLLVLASKRIQNCIRSQDKLARVGVAEFSLVLFTLENQDYAIAIAKRIQQELVQPFNIKGQEIVMTTNLGIAFYQPGAKIHAEELLRNSNLAQERAQILGKNRYAVFAPRMHSETVAQWQLESDLRHGIEHREFQLYYQPIINLKTDRLAGFEALVRWISPTRGFVSPQEFIPLSETTGLIIPLGDWILHEACRQMRQWHQQFNRPITININLSSHQFKSDLVAQVAGILEQTKLAPECLKLEITESAMMDDVEAAIALLKQLKDLGIKLSIDDFGTGYSSLSYLQQFCADTLKVDRSFVCQLESSAKNQAIVDIIVTLAHKLDMDVVAEGIETNNQLQMLRTLNCEYGQGYLFAKPLKSEAATDLLAQQFVSSN